MLDFYIINDEQSSPGYPENQGFHSIGGLSNKIFESLQIKGLIDERFDYYCDFRWGSSLIKQMRQNILKKQLQRDDDVKALMKLLDAAIIMQCGLIAYAD